MLEKKPENKQSKFQEMKKIIASIPRAFGLVWTSSRLLTISLLVTTLVTAFYPTAVLWFTKLVIDKITALAGETARGASIDLHPLWVLMLVLAIIWIVNRLIGVLHSALASLLEFKVGVYTQSLIINKCATLDVAFFENPKNFDMVENASRGAMMSAWGILGRLFSLIGTVTTLVTFLVILARLHWIAMAAVACSTLPELIIAPFFARLRWRMMTDRANDNRLCFYISRLITERDPAKEIRVFGLSGYLIDRFQFYWSKFFKQEMQFTKRRQTGALISGLLGTAATVGVWCYIIIQAVAKYITIGDVVLYTQAVENCQNYLIRLFYTGSDFYQQTLFLGNLFALLDIEPSKLDGALRNPEGSKLRWGENKLSLPIKKGIEFRNVSFRYPNSDKWVLRNLNFWIHPNESVALVGPNGAGKTTLVKLLVRLYDPTEGDIFLDGQNLREYELEGLRRAFGVIFQDYARYCFTLRENIGFGDVQWVDDMQRVKKAAAKAGADEIAMGLPNQYETYLGKQFMGLGVDLSGGEWQKIALGRAYMRECPILILDEPTASLDAFAEYDIYKGFAEMATSRTIVLISHRFSTVRMARNILVLENGELVENGHHEDLIARKGLYSSMFELQAERYR